MAKGAIQSGANILLTALLAGGAVYAYSKFNKPAQDSSGGADNGGDFVEPTPPQPPYIAKYVTRGSYSFFAATAYQEALLKDFLGIDPQGMPLDDYVAALSPALLNQWVNNWAPRFAGENMAQVVDFIYAKQKQYSAPVYTPPPVITPPVITPPAIPGAPISTQITEYKSWLKKAYSIKVTQGMTTEWYNLKSQILNWEATYGTGYRDGQLCPGVY